MVERVPSRRAFLAGLTAGGVASAAAAALPVLAASPASIAALLPTIAPPLAALAMSESPELLALGDQINHFLTTYRAALAAYKAARANAEANCPPLPGDLVCTGARRRNCCEPEVDVEGESVFPPNLIGPDGRTYAVQQRRIFNSVTAKAEIELGDMVCDGRTKAGKQLRKLILLAEQYEAERKNAIELSGVAVAADELCSAATDIDGLARDIRGFVPVTMSGVLVLARALAALAEVDVCHLGGWQLGGHAGSILGKQLAEALLRVQGNEGGMQAIA